jgi:hypothetical protein
VQSQAVGTKQDRQLESKGAASELLEVNVSRQSYAFAFSSSLPGCGGGEICGDIADEAVVRETQNIEQTQIPQLRRNGTTNACPRDYSEQAKVFSNTNHNQQCLTARAIS